MEPVRTLDSHRQSHVSHHMGQTGRRKTCVHMCLSPILSYLLIYRIYGYITRLRGASAIRTEIERLHVSGLVEDDERGPEHRHRDRLCGRVCRSAGRALTVERVGGGRRTELVEARRSIGLLELLADLAELALEVVAPVLRRVAQEREHRRVQALGARPEDHNVGHRQHLHTANSLIFKCTCILNVA